MALNFIPQVNSNCFEIKSLGILNDNHTCSCWLQVIQYLSTVLVLFRQFKLFWLQVMFCRFPIPIFIKDKLHLGFFPLLFFLYVITSRENKCGIAVFITTQFHYKAYNIGKSARHSKLILQIIAHFKGKAQTENNFCKQYSRFIVSVNIPNIALNNTRHQDKRCALPFTSDWQNWRFCAESCLILSKLIVLSLRANETSSMIKCHHVCFPGKLFKKKILWILLCINYIFFTTLTTFFTFESHP